MSAKRNQVEIILAVLGIQDFWLFLSGPKVIWKMCCAALNLFMAGKFY